MTNSEKKERDVGDARDRCFEGGPRDQVRGKGSLRGERPYL